MSLLRVEELRVYFPIRRGLFGRVVGYVKAVDGVSFNIEAGEDLAIVGETGSGKTTVLKTVLKLVKPTSGRILFLDKDVFALRGDEERRYRREVQAVFQNPHLSLNPRMKVRDIIAEPIRRHFKLRGRALKERVEELLRAVGLPEFVADMYPPNLSGGQAQRVAIARALSLNPRLLLLDEPTSALDVSVQAQILALLQRLKRELNITYILVTHDLSIVSYLAKRVLVLYYGSMVEEGSVDEVFRSPLHPYTQLLLSSVPEPDPERLRLKHRVRSRSESVAPLMGGGCKFAPRCPHATELCLKKAPPLAQVGGRAAACWLYN